MIKGTRPDLTLIEANGRPAALIEVVVTHDLEEGTRARYEELPISVFKTEPSWEGLEDEFQESFWAEPDSLNLPYARNVMPQKIAAKGDCSGSTYGNTINPPGFLPKERLTSGKKLDTLCICGATFQPRKAICTCNGQNEFWGLNSIPWYGMERWCSSVVWKWMHPR